MITVTHPRSGKTSFPVVIWTKIVLNILGHKGTSEMTELNVVKVGRPLVSINRDDMLKHLRHTVDNVTGLGLIGDDVDTHSIRSSLAMALYSSERPVSTIIKLYIWCSDESLLYV